MGSSKKKATKQPKPRARKSEPKPRAAKAKAAAPKPKSKGKPKPLAGARPTNRAKHPKGPAPELQPVPTEQPDTLGLVPGLHTRRGGRVTRRMTFYLPPDLAMTVERDAFEQRTSVSVIGQRVLEEHYAKRRKGAA